MDEPLPKIEKGVPIPPQGRKLQEGGLASVIRKMEVGDSIISTQKQRNGAFATGHYIKIKLASRTMSDGTIRIWRIK